LIWDIEGVIYTYGWRYVPSIAIRQRTTRGLIPYQGWVDKGILIEAGTTTINYDTIEKNIIQICELYQVQAIGYDSWNATQTVSRLKDAGVNMVQFIQGPKSYHPAMQALEVAYLGNKLIHNDDPILNWNASNLVARTDVNLNNAPDKKKSTEKIDDMVTLLMALGLCVGEKEETPEYQVFFV
jgi:phage terminase large subunit-like protein